MNLENILNRAEAFRKEAHEILGKGESAKHSRVYHLDESYQKLSNLTVKQDDMLRQSLRCIENEVFRAAVVLCWAAMTDYLQEFTAQDNFAALNAARPKWKDIGSLEELRENHTEYHLIDAMHVAKQITKAEKNAMHGLRNRRNECAHPSDYFPDLNEALGYFSEVIKRLDDHEKRTRKLSQTAKHSGGP